MSFIVSQFLRLLSIIAVLVIHGSHSAQLQYRQPDTADAGDFIGVLLNQLSRFAVPMFVFLSGYGLSIKFRKDQHEGILKSAISFYKNRLTRIGVPFIVWTIGILWMSHRIGYFEHDNLWQSVKTVGYTMYATGADYHFYFFTIILWCYLFFPLLARIRTGSWLHFSVLVLLFLVQITYQSPSHYIFQHYGVDRPKFPSSFFFKWLFYFYLGMTLAIYDLRKKAATVAISSNKPSAIWPAIFVVVSFAIVFAEYLYYNNGQDPGNFDHFHRYTIWFYTLSFIWYYRTTNDKLTNYFDSRPGLQSMVVYLAQISFTVYIIHTWILRLLQLGVSEMYSRLAILLIGSFAVAFILDRILSHRNHKLIHFLRLVLGLPK